MWWRRKQQDFSAEIEAHLQLEADQLRAEGVPPAEAPAAARRAFGNRTSEEERFYESRRCMFVHYFIRDVRFAARVLKKDATFTGLAVLGLALGLAVSTAIFALINAMVRAETAGEDRPSHVGLNLTVKGRRHAIDLSYSDYRHYRDHAVSFRALRAESFHFGFILGPLPGGKTGTEAEDVEGRFESANFLSAAGLQPAVGRSFLEEEEQPGGPPVALLNFGFWKRRFAADAGIVGKTVVLNAHALTVIGVADGRYGAGDKASFYLPLGLQPVLLDKGDWLRDPEEHWLMVDAWLRPHVTARQAQAEIDVLSSSHRRAKPTKLADEGVFVSTGGVNPEKRREILTLALAVIVAVSMILLIACSNLANLLLARTVVRRREIGVRLSLGASRGRLVCQLLTESMLLAVAGGALGLLLSHWLAKSLVVLLDAPGLELHLDPRVVLYGIVLSLATGISFGLAPALAATKMNLAQSLHADGLSGSPRSKAQRAWSARNVLVIVPLAVSLMLLMGAGLAVRLVQRINLTGPVFDTSRLIGMGFRLSMQGYDETRTRQFQETLLERIRTMPGVTSVALASAMPLSNGQLGWFPLLTEGPAIAAAPSSLHADYNVVSSGFFETIGVPIVCGRAFTTSDREGGPPVAMVNQVLASTYWPGEESIGKRIRLGITSTFFEIIGVAPDMEDANAAFNTVRPTVYVPYGQGKLFLKGAHTDAPPYQMQFLIRTSDDPQGVKQALRREAHAIDSTLRVNIETLAEMRKSTLAPLKTTSLLLSTLGALALIMASVGIYAILAYAVSQRTREIGIRMALGAQRKEILTLVMQRTLMLIAWGISLGLLGALALNRVFASQLGDIGGLDAVTCISVALLLGTVALFASYLPARKALRVDPVQALRCE